MDSGLSRGLSILSLCALVPLLLFGCSGSSSGSGWNSDEPLVLLDLLPASTRGFVHIKAEQLARLTPTAQPWRQHPLDVLSHYSAGSELLTAAQELVLAQSTDWGGDFLLLANIDPDRADELFQSLAGPAAGQYREQELHQYAGGSLRLVRLNSLTWAVGHQVVLEAAVDMSLDGGELQASPLAPYLPQGDAGSGVSFLYGLPALYVGQAATAGAGDSSLDQALAVRGVLALEGGQFSGQVAFITPNAQAYTERLLGLLPEGSPDIFDAAGDALTLDIAAMTSVQLRSLFKSMVHGMNAVDYAAGVARGDNPPWMNFDVGEAPNSIFINFEFAGAQQRSAFEAQHLPEGFTLAPLAILDSETPRYFLVLNIYQSSGGLVEGARAEWSVFVHDPDTDEPRFLVVQAAAENFTMDSVNGLTQPEPVSHELTPEAIVSYVGLVDEESGEENTYFSARIDWPQPPDADVLFARQFVVANDYIFWGNAVADRGLYNGTVHARNASLIEADAMTVQDNSRWAAYVESQPVHAVVYHTALEIVISPWWNLARDYLDVTGAYRQQLRDTRNGLYPPLVLATAEGAMQGLRPPLTTAMMGVEIYDGLPAEGVSTTFFHFALRDVQALLDYLGLTGQYAPLAIPYYSEEVVGPGGAAVYDDETPRNYLTLALYQLSDDACGARAEWRLVVATPEGRPMTLLLDSHTAAACLNAESLLALPAVVRQVFDSGTGNTPPAWESRIESAFSQLDVQMTFNRQEGASRVLPSLAWVEAGDRVCTPSGVCNANFYDGKTLKYALARMNPGDIDVRELLTPFDGFIDPEPAAVTVRDTPAILGTNPWVNVPAFGTP